MFGAKPPHNPNGDYEVPNAPADCISSLTWSPKGSPKTFLVVTSWDKSVRVWDIQKSNPQPVVQCNAVAGPTTNHDMPVLCSAISRDGRVFSGGCDKVVKCWELNQGGKAPYPVAGHDRPIKVCSWIDDANLLVTGGWDQNIKFWDLRSQQPACTINLPGQIVACDCSSYPMATFAVPKGILVYDMQNKREIKRMDPHHTMKEQLRCIGNFPNVQTPGFAAGSIEGRVCITYINDNPQDPKNFSFKCHRENDGVDIYAVHSISFHPVFGTFATAGANGNFTFWDKDSKQRLKQFEKANQPIPCAGFNDDGTLYGYAVSYDWSKGVEGYDTSKGHHILVHSVSAEEIKNKPKQARANTTTGRR